MIQNAQLITVDSVRCSRCGTRSSSVVIDATDPTQQMHCTDCGKAVRDGDVKHFTHAAAPAAGYR
jgi:transcription elongation factor Elf1